MILCQNVILLFVPNLYMEERVVEQRGGWADTGIILSWEVMGIKEYVYNT